MNRASQFLLPRIFTFGLIRVLEKILLDAILYISSRKGKSFYVYEN